MCCKILFHPKTGLADFCSRPSLVLGDAEDSGAQDSPTPALMGLTIQGETGMSWRLGYMGMRHKSW